MSHTPGPWKRVLTGIFTDEHDPQIVAYCDDHRNKKPRTPEEHLANACLMAASPGLLAELKRIVGLGVVEKDIAFSDNWRTTRAIIAKAERD